MFKIKTHIIFVLFAIKTWVKNVFSKPNKDALFIFGFQKSGTSAIAGLLARKTGKTVTLDTPYFWNPYSSKIILGDLKIENHVKKYSYPFSKEIIKEPATTFFIPKLQEYFKLNTYIFIVRNPFDNIRSILNRLGLPGNLENIDLELINKNWKYIFKDTKGIDYISTLAKRWVLANNQLKIINSNSCILVKYEDFKNSKEEFINNIAVKVGLEPKYPIAHLVDKQFQPKGKSDVDLIIFFGENNYKKIQSICGNLMKEFNY